jgi:hypothetical protein
MLIAPRGAHALMRMAVVGRRSFSFNDRAVDAPAPIVGERPMAAPQLARDVSAARPSRPELPAPYPSWLACKKAPATNVDLRLKAAGNGPDERVYWACVMQAYALFAAVRGAFGAGVSRG